MLAAMGLDQDRTRAFIELRHGMAPPQLMAQALTDATFRAPALAIAEARARHGLPTWLYEFAWKSTAPGVEGLAFHCLDLPFAFDLLHAEAVPAAAGDNPPQHLADAAHSAWVSFIRDLDPGTAWPGYTCKRRETMVWDAEPRVERDRLRPVRDIWATATSRS